MTENSGKREGLKQKTELALRGLIWFQFFFSNLFDTVSPSVCSGLYFCFSFHLWFLGRLAPLWRRLCLVLPRWQKGHPFTFLALYSSELSQWGQLGTREGITQKYITVEGRFWSPFKKLGSHENTITQKKQSRRRVLWTGRCI